MILFGLRRQKGAVRLASLKAANALINDKCGYPKRTRSTEIYTVKKHKGHDYSDLIDAYTNVKSGYDLLFKDVDRKSAIAKIENGIEIWEDALEETNPFDNKDRVNKKVTALLYANLAEAYMWINDFDAADNYLQKAKIGGVSKYKTFAKRLQRCIEWTESQIRSKQLKKEDVLLLKHLFGSQISAFFVLYPL